MTPAARDAFGQIAGARIVSGVVNLRGPLTGKVYAMGVMDGVEVEITCD